jgi:hypothetical protein
MKLVNPKCPKFLGSQLVTHGFVSRGLYECIPLMAGNFEAGCVVLDDDNDENVSNDAGDLASSEPPSFAAEEQALTPTDVE